MSNVGVSATGVSGTVVSDTVVSGLARSGASDSSTSCADTTGSFETNAPTSHITGKPGVTTGTANTGESVYTGTAKPSEINRADQRWPLEKGKDKGTMGKGRPGQAYLRKVYPKNSNRPTIRPLTVSLVLVGRRSRSGAL